ncbi:MAG: single-stranded DNA-binding protein [Chloroflexota bacterium]
MAMINGTLIGRVGSDPVTREVGNNKTVTEVQIAYQNRRSSNPQTEWIKVEAWNGLGTNVVAKYVSKGDQIAVTYNHVHTEGFLTRDGEPASKLVIRASDVELLSNSRSNNNNEPDF